MNKIIISLICFVAALVLIFFMIAPLWSSVKVLKESNSMLAQKTAGTEKLLAKEKQLEQKYLELEEEAKKVFLATPAEKDISYLLIQFEGLALQNGLLLEGINFAQTAQDEVSSRQESVQSLSPETSQNKELSKDISVLSVDISVSGSYEAFKGYLNSLENNVRPIDIKRIDVKLLEEKDTDFFSRFGVFDFVLVVDVYYAG